MVYSGCHGTPALHRQNLSDRLFFFSRHATRVKHRQKKPESVSKPAEPAHRSTWSTLLLCIAATVVSLAPFANKAFNIDDTLFLAAARQIIAHPLDPYGFQINWTGTEQPMTEVTQNGPLASYYIALAASCVGWNEIALHLAFLIPAAAVVLGTYLLAARFCLNPLLAAMATLWCPVFLLSSTTLMCDVMMLAFWVWATVLWLRSATGGTHGPAILAAVLMAAASVTKYSAAVSLVPLLLVYSLARWQRGTMAHALSRYSGGRLHRVRDGNVLPVRTLAAVWGRLVRHAI